MTAFDPTPLRPDTPAMPFKAVTEQHAGLTARQHAAISLRVPDSGCEWLDAMIRASLRDEMAARAMQGSMTAGAGAKFDYGLRAEFSYKQAEVMMVAREVQS